LTQYSELEQLMNINANIKTLQPAAPATTDPVTGTTTASTPATTNGITT
jgi:hypothetical protein